MDLNFKISGLKCDNPNCDFCDPSIPFEEYKNYVNYPCPKCGESLLTPKAYKMCLALSSMGNFLTKITGGAKTGMIDREETEMLVHLDMDKDGHLGIKK